MEAVGDFGSEDAEASEDVGRSAVVDAGRREGGMVMKQSSGAPNDGEAVKEEASSRQLHTSQLSS